MRAGDLGEFYTTNGMDIWQLVTYTDRPTACMENVRTGVQRDGVVGCSNLRPFKKLVVEDGIKPQND